MRNKNKVRWYPPRKWKVKKNYTRSDKKKYHPSIVVGEKGFEFADIGVTSSRKREHHVNEELHFPQKNGKPSYLRDDVQFTNKSKLTDDADLKLHDSDIPKVLKIIEKFKKKCGKH